MNDNIKLSIEDMNLFYGNFHALKDINMHIPEKEITAFIVHFVLSFRDTFCHHTGQTVND